MPRWPGVTEKLFRIKIFKITIKICILILVTIELYALYPATPRSVRVPTAPARPFPLPPPPTDPFAAPALAWASPAAYYIN